MKYRFFATVLATAALAIPLRAQTGVPSSGSSTTEPAASVQASTSLTEGEVRKVDKDAGKITLKHGPIQNLEMPAMTMVFRVKDASMLDKVKAGDKVRFSADKIGGALTITQIDSTP